MKPTLLLLIFAGAAFAQPADPRPAFEVATVKPAVPFQGKGIFNFGSSGGPGTRDPGRYACDHCSLSDLIAQAYGLKRFQLSAPAWLESEYFDIAAKVPEGATKDQLKLMLQGLLQERFQLASHSEQRDTPIYELVVAKGGPKLTPHVDLPAGADPDPPAAAPARGTLDSDGYPVLLSGRRGAMIVNGRNTTRRINESMEQFASLLSNSVGRPVKDATGLTGTYESRFLFSARFSSSSGSGWSRRKGPPTSW
jgi:uncharacterized protein (TIGR03435 family)